MNPLKMGNVLAFEQPTFGYETAQDSFGLALAHVGLGLDRAQLA